MKIRKCPFCFIDFKGGSRHIYTCRENKDTFLNKNEIKYLFYKFNFKEICDKEILEHEYLSCNLSLVDIRDKYKIDFKSTIFLLDFFNIKKRNSSDSAKIISVPKQRKTIFKKHGVKWSSQIESVKELKRKNNIERYGVDNIWKSDWFKTNRDNFFIEKHGMNVSEYNKLYWLKLSEDDKKNHMINSVFKSSINSSIELRIKSILDMMCIEYISQKKIKNGKGSLYFFDICVGDILIEINGDFWHANPQKYKNKDILKFPKKEIIAESLWIKDKNKYKEGRKNGYNIVYLWENFIRNSTNEILIETLKDIIKDRKFKKYGYNQSKS